MKGQRKRTLAPCILVLQPSPNRPHYDIQGKGTPKRRIPIPRGRSVHLVGDYLSTNLIRIFDTDKFTRDVLQSILLCHSYVTTTWTTDAMQWQKYKIFVKQENIFGIICFSVRFSKIGDTSFNSQQTLCT